MPGLSFPLIAKLCAAAAVTAGLGVATYEVAAGDRRAAEVEVASPAPEGLSFSDEISFPEEPSEIDGSTVPKAPPGEEASEKEAKPEPEANDEAKPEPEAAEDETIAEKEKPPVDSIAPELVILHPLDGSHFEDRKVVFEGETEPGATVKAGPYAADVDATGAWRIELILSAGQNRAVLTATDAAGNVSEASVTVHLDVEREKRPVEKEVHDKEPHEKDPGPDEEDEPKAVEFAANQKWGYCEEEVPYDVFWGTATPNTVVHIVSAHGGAEVEVDKHGFWEKKVYFESAPRGEAFLVVVEGVNGRAELQFFAKPLRDVEVVK